MLHWLPLTSHEELAALKNRSKTVPCLIFKHSTRCEISAIAKYRLESDWAEIAEPIEAYYLDLIAHRPVSAAIAEDFEVHHESPQALLVVDGDCIFDASHLDISAAALQEALAAMPISN